MTTAVATPAAAPESKPTHRKEFRYDIGGLRGLAIIIVVTGHLFEDSGLLKWPEWINTLANYAAHKLDSGLINLGVIDIHGGVDMSFALSGYLITWLAISEFTKYGTIRMLAFYGRRARRLLPAATLVTLATLVAAWQWLSPLKLRDIAGDGLAASASLLNYWLAYNKTDYFAAIGVDTSPFKHYWSLNVEEQFYLVYPALLLLALVIGRKYGRLRLTVGVMLAVIVAVSLTCSIIQTSGNKSMAYFGAHTRAWELALGALVAVAQPLFKRLPKVVAAILSWFGLATVLVTVCIIERFPLPGFAVGGPVLGVLLVIAGGEARPRFGAESLLRFPPLQYIGRVSYQWYLWHWPVLIILPVAVGTKLDQNGRIGVVLLSFVLAVLTWHFVDGPIRKVKAYGENPGKALGLGGHFMAASLIASIVMMFAYWPSTPITPQVPGAAPSFTPLTQATRPVGELPQLIEEGLKLKQLPPPIKAVLPKVEQQDGVIGCLTDYKLTQLEPCIVGNTAATTSIAILGDSHARHWQQALDAIGKRRGIKVVIYAKQSCPAEPYVHIDPQFNTRYTQCEQWRDAAYTQIEAQKPKVVILSSLVWDDITAEAVTTATKRFLALGIKVVALGNAPRPDGKVPECLSEYSRDVQECTLQRSTATYRPDLRELRRKASVAAGALFIDPMDWFCNATLCPALINGIVVYPDGYHVSGTYAHWVSPKLEAALAPVLK